MHALPAQALTFLWLELTSRCNLRCVHCYAESGPSPSQSDLLTTKDYCDLLSSAAALGCRRVQFIGGEPTLHRDLPLLIARARAEGFEFVEVYTNATRVSAELLSCFVEYSVAVAVSFYADDASIHDTITNQRGSHARTVRTLRRLLDADLELRAGIIEMEPNKGRTSKAISFLRELGVNSIGVDRVRRFGRGANDDASRATSDLSELCGSCWRGSLCVSPNGTVSPCIMSKAWAVGSVVDTPLGDLAASQSLHEIRSSIYNAAWVARNSEIAQGRIHGAYGAAIDSQCEPVCNPRCSPNCSPCYPYGQCDPQLFCGPCGPRR